MLTKKDNDPISYGCQNTNMLNTPLAEGLAVPREMCNAAVYIAPVKPLIPSAR